MSAVIDMFADLKPPRQKPRILAHVSDAHEGEGFPICRMTCAKCGWESEWLEFDTATEAKRGIPCERCNGGAP